MVLKRKTVSKVGSALKAVGKATVLAMKAARKAKDMDVEESSEEEEVATPKIIKKPAAAAAKKITRKEVEESEEESEEDEEESEEEESKAPCKTMKKSAAAAKKNKVESEEESEEEEEESDEEEVPSKTMKKPAAAGKKMQVEKSEAEESEAESEEEEAVGQIVLVEEKKDASEKEVVAERTAELKAMYVSDLKELVLSLGLEKGSRDAMIKALVKHEAKVRAAAQEHKAKIRGVVIKKKQELEDLSLSELGKLCNDMGLKGLKSKPERVQRLLVQWQETDGVDKALAQIAQDARQQELEALDDAKLRKLCTKLGVDPFVKEIAVDRISKQENTKGFYSRPAVKEPEEAPVEQKKDDMIEALLASEAQRKKEKELKNKQEEVMAQKMKEFKAMSVEELSKRIAKKGLKMSSEKAKREDMIQALFIAAVQDDAAIARKNVLQAKSTQDLKDLVLLNGLETGSKEAMVKSMLAHEATVRDELKVFESHVEVLAAKRQEELAKKSSAQLKALCSDKDLPVKGDQEERIQRILEEAKKDREFDKMVSMNNRQKRKQELMALDKSSVLKMCEKTDVDPFVNCIIVERIIAHETRAGQAIAAKDVEQPAAKRARK